MDYVFGLIGLTTIGIPVAVVYLLISHAGLKKRVKALEKLIAAEQVSTSISTVNTPFVPTRPPVITRTHVAQDSSPVSVSAPAKQPSPSKAVVFKTDTLRTLMTWITQNWFYAVSAVSLALAGIFLVIYGMEQGLLPPAARVIASLVFGGALIGAGEFIRRRYSDADNTSTAYLPSTFSGAGIVTLFGAVLSARLLYDFIGPEMALAAMAIVAAIALVLGWLYGPLLAAVGLIGAMVSPFIVGGSSDDPWILLVYFGMVTTVGLAIDTMRRWAWVSVLALVLGYGAGFVLVNGSVDAITPEFILYCVALTIAAIAIPVRKLMPDHAGTLLSMAVLARKRSEPWPEFPTRIAAGAVIAASLLILLTAIGTVRADIFWIAVLALAGLALALLIWAKDAPALVDLTVFPAMSLTAIVAAGAPIWQWQSSGAHIAEADMPMMASLIIALGILLSSAAAWRSLRGGPSQLFLALSAAIMAPALAIAIEVFWQPAKALGATTWALHAVGIGAVMVGIAERFARTDGPDHRNRMSFAVLSALAALAFSMVILFSSAALTSAIAITIVAAAWLDRRFNLPLMGIYILVGITAVVYRLILDPGIDWAIYAPMPEMLLSHAGAVIAFAVSYVFVRAARRENSMVLLESAIFSSTGILLSLLLYRTITAVSPTETSLNHWSLGFIATVWIILGMAQLRRRTVGGSLAWVRSVLGALFIGISVILVLALLLILNPVFYVNMNEILGPSVLNTLIPAYLLPAGVFAFGAWWLSDLPKNIRVGFASITVVMSAMWLGLTIRHFWRGAMDMGLPGIEQPELYSYTVALLLIGAGLFYQSLARQNAMLRKAGLIVIGLAVAKVFIMDIQGLGGLIRVFSLLFLGLSLAGLAWLNRWAVLRSNGEAKES